MNFHQCLPISMFMLFTGAAFTSAFCIIFGRLFKLPYRNSRFVSFSLLMTVSVVSVVWIIFSAKDLLVNIELLTAGDITFFSILFVLGVLCSRFWKVVLPAVCLIYIALSVYTALFLYSTFGTSENRLSIRLTKETVSVDQEDFPVGGAAADNLTVKVYTLPARLLVPFPRCWCVLQSVTSTDAEEFQSAKTDISADNKFKSWLLEDTSTLKIQFPTSDFLPAVYQIDLVPENQNKPYFIDRAL